MKYLAINKQNSFVLQSDYPRKNQKYCSQDSTNFLLFTCTLDNASSYWQWAKCYTPFLYLH